MDVLHPQAFSMNLLEGCRGTAGANSFPEDEDIVMTGGQQVTDTEKTDAGDDSHDTQNSVIQQDVDMVDRENVNHAVHSGSKSGKEEIEDEEAADIIVFYDNTDSVDTYVELIEEGITSTFEYSVIGYNGMLCLCVCQKVNDVCKVFWSVQR